jgi:hypothetical protein
MGEEFQLKIKLLKNGKITDLVLYKGEEDENNFEIKIHNPEY